jgi:orotidine-5'-phosphate decarboxylase
MSAPSFAQRVQARWRASQSLLCVGLDPDPARFPASLRGSRGAIARFCCDIVDATAKHACAFKPQIAYFAAERAEDQLEDVLAHIRAKHPDIPVILDAKRGDIGSTAEQYAREAFERYQADAVTLSPFMGQDTIAPFLAYEGKGCFLLCRTSNPGGNDLQMLRADGEAVFERIARLAAGPWNGAGPPGRIGLVVGATYPQELQRVRALAPNLPLLVPGIGAQGGDVVATVQAGLSADGTGLLINSSRAILYASAGDNYAAAAAQVAQQTCQDINAARGLAPQR